MSDVGTDGNDPKFSEMEYKPVRSRHRSRCWRLGSRFRYYQAS